MITPDGVACRVLVDGQDVTDKLQASEVSEATSIAAAHGRVREGLRTLQRSAYEPRPLVAEGRDMGTVVFQDAPIKFFIVADEDVKKLRRQAQLGGKVSNIDREISERDKRDTQRRVSPTLPAQDAVIVDNSSKPLEQVLELMVKAVEKRLAV